MAMCLPLPMTAAVSCRVQSCVECACNECFEVLSYNKNTVLVSLVPLRLATALSREDNSVGMIVVFIIRGSLVCTTRDQLGWGLTGNSVDEVSTTQISL